MAGYPPPNPYNQSPQGQPYPLTARQQRQAARQQAKIRQAAFRAQRAFARQQSRSLRRGSVVGPLLVLAFGVVALLVSIGRLSLSRTLTWFGHWWPLLIIAAGLILVFEWAFDQWSAHNAGEQAVAPGRRSLGGGAVLLLILLIAAGLSAQTLHATHVLGNDFFTSGFNGNNWNQMFEDKYDREQQLDQSFSPGTNLSVTNPRGAVVVLGRSGDDKIHITINKQIYSHSQGEADQRAAQLVPALELSGGTLHLTMPELAGATSDLNITLPETAEVAISADRGDVRLSNLAAPVTITANHGDLELNQIGGSVMATMNNRGSSFMAHHIQGNLELRGKADDLSATDITGSTVFTGEFYGDTHLEHLASSMSFHSNRTQLVLARLNGEIDMSPDADLTGSEIVGPVDLHTRNRNINFTRVAGNVLIVNSNGSVDTQSELPLGNVSIENRNGAVSVTLPTSAGLNLHAETHEGTLQNDFGIPVTDAQNRSQATGTVGSGSSQISIATTHADIRIRKQDATVQPLESAPSPTAKIQRKTGKA